MSKYDKKAKDLNDAVWSEECNSNINYDDDLVRRSIVHARMDIVPVISHLSSVNSQLSVIKWILIAILAAIIFVILN